MKLLIIFLVVSTVTTGVFSKERRGVYQDAIESCNRYIDDLVSLVITNLRAYLDPYITEDSLLVFHRKVVLVDVRGVAELAPGQVIGLSNLHRISPCAISFENDRLKLSARLKIPTAVFRTTGTLKFLKMGSEIAVEVYSSDITVNIAFTNLLNGTEALFEKFKVDHFNEIHAQVHGLGMMKWMKSAVESSASTLFSILIKNAIEYRIQHLVAGQFKENPFTLEEFEIGDREIFGTTQDERATTEELEISDRETVGTTEDVKATTEEFEISDRETVGTSEDERATTPSADHIPTGE